MRGSCWLTLRRSPSMDNTGFGERFDEAPDDVGFGEDLSIEEIAAKAAEDKRIADRLAEREELDRRAARADKITHVTLSIVKVAATVALVVLAAGLVFLGCRWVIEATRPAKTPEHVLIISKGTKPEARYRQDCDTVVRYDYIGDRGMYVDTVCTRVIDRWEDVSSYVWSGCTTDSVGQVVRLSRSGDYSYSDLVGEGKTSDGEWKCTGRVVVNKTDLPDIEKLSWRQFTVPT